jgi:hypothetical protein
MSKQWGKDLLDGHVLRNKAMHSAFGESLPTVTKQEQELIRSAKALLRTLKI